MSDSALIAATLAERLGLPGKPGSQGVLDGAPIRVRVATVRNDPHHHHHHAVFVLDPRTGQISQPTYPLDLVVDAALPFDPKLDAHLHVRPLAGFDALRSAGRSTFAERFAAGGAEADRVEALVGADARAALDRSFVGDAGPVVKDAGVSWTWRRATPWPSADEIAAAIRELPAVWRSVSEAARRVRPPTGAEPAMVVLAGIRLPAGLEMRGSPAGIAGTLRGIAVSISVRPNAQAPGAPPPNHVFARVTLGLPEPIPGAPKVVREDKFGWMDRIGALLSGRPEIIVGHKAFDRRFAVRSLKPDALKAALSPAVREAMLVFDGSLPMHLTGAGVDGSGQVGLDKLPTVVARTLALAEAFASG